MSDKTKAHFTFESKAKVGELLVLRFSGSEAISEQFRFQIDLVSKKPDIDLGSVVNKAARLTMEGLNATREVVGLVTRFELLQVEEKRSVYRATLESPQARLAMRRRLRIFQQKTTREIISKVLQDGGVNQQGWDDLKATYKPRDYCVQYRETDLDFISRLMEEEGISFYFEHAKTGLKVVHTDKSSSFKDIPGQAKVRYSAGSGHATTVEFVHDLTFGQQLCPVKVELRDYNFKKPDEDVKSKAGKDSALEIYDYPGEFIESSLGDRLAEVRLQELNVHHKVGVAGSSCNRFEPGRTFTLGGSDEKEKHPRSDLNRKYLVTRVVHTGEQPSALEDEGGSGGSSTTYANTITVIPSGVEFRPPRVTPRPEALGTHTATVVGNEEIMTDKYGRAKVWFHWDRESKRDEKSSCWIRVSHGWAGASYGMFYQPRTGQEVLVSFLEGDPDRPIITGRVYNGKQEVPYDLPANKTVSTIKSNSSPNKKGYNELKFEDKAGKERVTIHAQKDLNLTVRNNYTSAVGNDQSESVGNEYSLKVGKNFDTKVTLDSTHSAKTVEYSATESIKLTVGGSSIELKPGDITIKSPMIKMTATGVATILGGMVKIN